MNRRVTVHHDRALDTRPVVVEIPNPNAPRTRLHLTRTEARELKKQLATVLKGDHHVR